MVDISRAIVEERLNLDALTRESDEEAICRLMELPGVGRWMVGGPGLGMRLLQLGDTCVLVDPGSFANRLEVAGFQSISVDADRFAFRFRAVTT